MNNYLLMGHILRCHVIPKDEVHPQLWVGANRKFRTIPRDRIARVAHNKVALNVDVQHEQY
jgi:nucleolar protein 15